MLRGHHHQALGWGHAIGLALIASWMWLVIWTLGSYWRERNRAH